MIAVLGWTSLGFIALAVAIFVLAYLAANESGQSADVQLGGAYLFFFALVPLALGLLIGLVWLIWHAVT